MCLDILFSSCQSSKTFAIDQNFLKKVIDICSENCGAIYCFEIQKQLKQRDAPRKYRYVTDPQDIETCEREAIRMISLIRNLFYDSSNLLTSFVMPAQQ